MKPLKKEFTSGKGSFRQLYAAPFGYVYERTFYGREYYEVFKHVEYPRFGCVSYPGDRAFGNWAWCYVNETMAADKLAELEIDYYHKK